MQRHAHVPLDFSGEDLRGHGFDGADLQGASFASADLRGASFRDADLRGADLRGARTGLARRGKLVLVLFGLVLSIAAGVAAGLGGRLIQALVASDRLRMRVTGIAMAIELCVFLVAGVWRGLRFAVGHVLPVVGVLAVAVALLAMVTGMGPGGGAMGLLAFALLNTAVVALGAFARLVAGNAGRAMFVLVAVIGALTGRALGGEIASLVIAVAMMGMARRASGRPELYPTMSRLGLAVASSRGTRFRGAKLGAARLDGVRFELSDFRGADFTGARLDGATFDRCTFDSGEPRRS